VLKDTAAGEDDPDLQVLKMMSARSDVKLESVNETGHKLAVVGETK
jgi:hypothetical protein